MALGNNTCPGSYRIGAPGISYPHAVDGVLFDELDEELDDELDEEELSLPYAKMFGTQENKAVAKMVEITIVRFINKFFSASDWYYTLIFIYVNNYGTFIIKN